MTIEPPDGLTPSQTIGPFFAYALTPAAYPVTRPVFSNDVASADAAGQRIRIAGRVLDGDGAPVIDAMVEIWQADGAGRYPAARPGSNAAFRGFGRTECGPDGTFAFTTVKPGAVPGPDGAAQAPHISVSVFARGLLDRVATRIYFADEAAANAADPILALVPADRRPTLLAAKQDGPGDPTYAFTIRLQGADETVFFTF